MNTSSYTRIGEPWENYSPPPFEPLLLDAIGKLASQIGDLNAARMLADQRANKRISDLSQKFDAIADEIEDRMNHLLKVVRRQEL